MTGEREYIRIVEKLKSCSLVYLATPYTKYPHGLDRAATDAACIAARLVEDGVVAFAPVVYTHPLDPHCAIDPTDQRFWMEFDEPFMNACDALAVAQMPGWKTSAGITQEIRYFSDRNRPFHFLPVDWLLGADH